MGWTIRVSIPTWTRDFSLLQKNPDRQWRTSSLLFNSYRVFPVGVHRPWQEINRSTSSHTEDKNECSYSSLSPICLPAADREHPTLSLPVSYSNQRTTATIVPNWTKIHRSTCTAVTQPNVTSLKLHRNIGQP